MTDITVFAALLRDAIGLDAASIGMPAIERAVQERQAMSRMPDAAAYWNHVCTSQTALQDLIEAVVVPETWFFRDREAFNALARKAQEDWPRTRSDRPLRLLSLPCATGEEPYSMAMALLEAGLEPARFQIDAIDVSARALQVAERGVYGHNSFRGADLGFRDRHFIQTQAGARLSDTIRRQVRFIRSNLFAPDLLPEGTCYDVIFCRNLLIYFDRETQDRSITMLEQLLLDDGVLFVGPSETGLLLSHRFASVRIPLAFAFRKAQIEPASAAKPSVVTPHLRPRPMPRLAQISRFKPKPLQMPPAPLAAAVRAEPNLAEAAQLADRGRLAEAKAICTAHIRRGGDSAEACYLMGLIQDSDGDPQGAERLYRKALYLDQNHRETMAHLALLLERRGDKAAARLLHNRAQRVRNP